MKNITTKDTKPGTPKTDTKEIVNTLIGISTSKEFTNKFNPYNNKNANITRFTTFKSFPIIRIT